MPPFVAEQWYDIPAQKRYTLANTHLGGSHAEASPEKGYAVHRLTVVSIRAHGLHASAASLDPPLSVSRGSVFRRP